VGEREKRGRETENNMRKGHSVEKKGEG